MKKRNFVYQSALKSKPVCWLVVIFHGEIDDLLSELLGRYGDELICMRTKGE